MGLGLGINRHDYRWHGRFGIPHGNDAALAFYLHEMMVPNSRPEAIAAPLVRTAPKLANVILTRKDNRGIAGRISDLENIQAEISQILNVPERDLYFLILNDHRHSNRRQSVLFIFDDVGRSPVAVAKLRDLKTAAVLEREYETLKYLRDKLSAQMRNTLPNALAKFVCGSTSVMLESALDGPSVYFEMRNSRSPEKLIDRHLGRSIDWLTCFQKETGTRRVKFSDVFETEVAFFFDRLRLGNRLSTQESALIDDALAVGREHANSPIQLAAVHGDFWTRNVLSSRSRTCVADWEDYCPEGSPLIDAAMFLVSYGQGFQWQFGKWLKPQEAFRRTFGEANELSEKVRVHLERFCEEVGLDFSIMRVLFPAFLARMSVGEADEHKAFRTNEKGVGLWRCLFQEYASARQNVFFG